MINQTKKDISDTTAGDFYPYLCGAASIEFRHKAPYTNSIYILNGMGDGWFRATEYIAKGYGLAIVSIKVTSTKPTIFHHTRVYKAKMSYIPPHFEEVKDAEDAFIYIHVHNDYTIEDVLNYINSNSKKWRA